jgi:sugar/nucleoside kinase (ribokinase family)
MESASAHNPPTAEPARGRAAQVVVAGHICLDIIPRWPVDHAATRIDPGALVEVGQAEMSTGGAVANVGLCLHRLGAPARLIGRIGDDLFARAVEDRLRRADVACDGLIRAAGESTSYSVVISPPGVDRSFLHCPGANHAFDPADIDVSQFSGAKILHFGYPPLMRGTYDDGGQSLAAMFARARHANLASSLDMAVIDPHSPAAAVDWPRFLETVLPHVDIFVPSADELGQMLPDVPPALADESALRAVASRLHRLGPFVVMLKLGARGIFVSADNDAGKLARLAERLPLHPADWLAATARVPCFRVHVAGTTGAGDATIAGFLGAILAGHGLRESATLACGVGACSVESADASAGVPLLSAVKARIAAGWATAV